MYNENWVSRVINVSVYRVEINTLHRLVLDVGAVAIVVGVVGCNSYPIRFSFDWNW